MQGLKILIINENDNFNEVAAYFLGQVCQAAYVETAGDAVVARDKWKDLSPHVIFLNMDLHSFELCMKIREELSRTKIVGMLLFDEDLNYYRSCGSGIFDEFISKECFGEQVPHLLQTLSSGMGKGLQVRA